MASANKTPAVTDLKTVESVNYTAIQTGPLDKLLHREWPLPHSDKPARGKFFLKEFLGLTGMQVSLNQLPAGKGTPFIHSHKENEELYLFFGGQGELLVDGDLIPVTEGSAVRISVNGERAIRNTSQTEDLFFIVVQAKEGSLSQHTFDDGIRSKQAPPWH